MAIAKTAETFNYKVVRQFALVTVLWGIVGMRPRRVLFPALERPCVPSGIARPPVATTTSIAADE